MNTVDLLFQWFSTATVRGAFLTLVVLAVQVAVGAFAAVSHNEVYNGFHVALATLVWAGVLTTALLTLPRTDRVPQLSRLALETNSK